MIKPAQRSPVSQPPKMARRNIPWVLWELLLRMRLDLLLVLALCGGPSWAADSQGIAGLV